MMTLRTSEVTGHIPLWWSQAATARCGAFVEPILGPGCSRRGAAPPSVRAAHGPGRLSRGTPDR